MRLSKVWVLILSCSAFALAAEEHVIENNQIKVTFSANDATLTPGHKTTLVIEIEPRPKIHLYAPGAKGYLAVDWQMDQSKAWNALPTVFPTSHMLNLPAINETVPVFSDRIRLVRDLTLGPEADLQSALGTDRVLAVAGSLQYQACDDKLCYFPKTIPITWNFKVAQAESHPTPERKAR
jgi:hypothetical protein